MLSTIDQIKVLDGGLGVLCIALMLLAIDKASQSRRESNPIKMKIAKWMFFGFIVTVVHFVAQFRFGLDSQPDLWIGAVILNGIVDVALLGCGFLLHWREWE